MRVIPMRLIPKRWWTKTLLILSIVFVVAALVGFHYVRDLVLTGGSSKTDRPKEDGIAGVGSTVMVVGTSGGPAQDIGLEILKRGGNAMDAALATAMGQITLIGGSWVSFAGINNIVYYEAATGKVYNMNAAFSTVQAESDYEDVPGIDYLGLLSEDKEGHYNGRTVPVPGFMRGVESAHQRFGQLPIAEVFQPVIDLAETGFEVNGILANQFAFRRRILSHDPETRVHFVKEDGSFYQKGDTFRQPALAETLRQVVAHGADYMYTGAWGQKYVEKVRAIGGRITMEDMTAYQAMWVEPLHTQHNGFDVYTHGLPAYGGVNLLEALNLVEAGGFRNKPHYSKSPESFYWMAQLLRPGNFFFCRNMWGESDTINTENLLARITPEHAERLWAHMQQQGGFAPIAPSRFPKHSDGVVVVDAEGNMAALLHTINTLSFGESGLVIDGVSVPDSLVYQLDVARITPGGERLPDPTCLAVVLKSGKPYAAFSSIGAGLHERAVTVIHNVLDFGMTPGEANNQPAYGESLNFPGWLGTIWGSYQTLTTGELSLEFEEQVADKGLEIVFNRHYCGTVVGVTIDPETGKRHGGTSKQLDGKAVGD